MNLNPRHYFLRGKRRREETNKSRAAIAEVQREARSLAIEAGCEAVPRDFMKIARYLNAEDIRYVPLAMRGRIMNENGTLFIEINSGLQNHEKRFTVAHEIGHIIVEKQALFAEGKYMKGQFNSKTAPHSVVERLCDAVAEELLVPLPWLEESVYEEKTSINLLKKIAEEAEISISVVAKRVYDEELWRCRFIWWKKDVDNFRAVKSYPYYEDDFLAHIETVDPLNSLLAKCNNEGSAVRGKERLRMGDETYLYDMECSPLNEEDILSVLYFDSRDT